MKQKKYIFLVGENLSYTKPETDVYVRATEQDIRNRMYVGGFLRFLSACYDDADKYGKGTKIGGKKILGLKGFDKWRKEHNCV